MVAILILVLVEILSLTVLRQHFYKFSKAGYIISLMIHLLLSIWFWILLIDFLRHDSFFDTPGHIWSLMALVGMFGVVIVPRILVIILHFTGRWKRRETGGHIRWLTNAGLIISLLVLTVAAIGTFQGKFNFKHENVQVKIKGLHPDLEGIKIVHISDLHLSGFYHHIGVLREVIDDINNLEPDLVFDTGDFITFGWREFGRSDTLLTRIQSKYGNYAVMGNHDAGTYHPEYSAAELMNHKLVMNNLVTASGYKVLNDAHEKLKVGNAVMGIIGVTTAGSHPEIIHGNIDTALAGLDSTDLQILLTHDPNHWLEDIEGKHPEINLTLSGHTHGMQMGIFTRKFRWSPSKFFYPHWNGLYKSGEQYHYVNRGLGVLAIPFRIWMPPEITILTLSPA